MCAQRKGFVITTSVSLLKKVTCDEVWLITRAGRDITDTIRVRGLAPSSALYQRYLTEWQGKEPSEWWPQYQEDFNRELRTEEKLVHLRKLWKLVKMGKVIALACFCKDNRYCHRSLVGQFLSDAGIYVEEMYRPESQDPREPQYKQLTLNFEAGEK